MNSKAKYKTKQREMLLGYFETVPGIHVTAADVCDYLKAQGASIGQSTVYRQLENLVDEGIIKKYIIDGNSPACFEYFEQDSHADTDVCFHCKCEKCGRLIHMDCDELQEIRQHLLEHHGFAWDSGRTVFYGICDQCQSS